MVKIIENYEIKNDSTFRIGGTVKKVALPENFMYNERVKTKKNGHTEALRPEGRVIGIQKIVRRRYQ